MSEEHHKIHDAAEKQVARARVWWSAHKASKRMLWLAGSVVLLIVVLLVGVTWYSTTADFQRRVTNGLVTTLEDSTGGKVELGSIKVDLWHLAIEAHGLVIHGLEGPGEAPYLAADRIVVRLKIRSLFTRMVGGAEAHVGLSYLHIDRPSVHLIIDKDGHTNQPIPKKKSSSTTPVSDTLLDLQAKRVGLANGVALLNDRAIPFDLAANNLQVAINYLSATDRYGATIDLNDLRTKMMKEPEVQSRLHTEVEFGRDMAAIKTLTFDTGKTSRLTASADLRGFANPNWRAQVDGTMELHQITLMAGFDGLTAGTVDLHLKGHSCEVAPAVAQTHPRFWERKHKDELKGGTRVLPPDPDCAAGYLMVGEARLHNAGYVDQYVRLHDVNGGAQLHITPTELLLTALTGYLPGGGSAEGRLRISNWLGEVPATAPVASPTIAAAQKTANATAKGLGAKEPATGSRELPHVAPAHAYLDVVISKIPVRTVMDITAPKDYGDLGFDSAVSGPVQVEWGGPAKDISETVVVDGDLKFAPSGGGRRGARSNIPVSGEAKARYYGRGEIVKIERAHFTTPQSTIDARGILGVNKGDAQTALNADVTVRDLGEFDQLFTTLGLEANGHKGTAAIPVVLHGALQFHGTASGPVRDLDVKGHLEAQQVEAKLGTVSDTLVDSVVSDAEYSPYEGVAVASSTIKRGTAVLNVQGTFKPRRIPGRGLPNYVWDGGLAVDAKLQLKNAQVQDVLQIAGQQQKLDVTGTMNADVRVAGTLNNLDGGGHVALVGGAAYGEPFQSAVVDVTVRGQEVAVSKAVAQLHGVTLTGNGAYDMGSKHVRGHLEGNKLQLSQFVRVKNAMPNADGVLTFVADANGTLDEPGLKATLRVTGVTVNKQVLGDVAADVHSERSTVFYTSQSTLVGAKFDVVGQTELKGDFATQAKMTVAGLDVSPVMKMYGMTAVDMHSLIAGTVTVSGPAKNPTAMSGTMDLTGVSAKLQGIELKAAGPVRARLAGGVATLEPVEITGPDTDLHASGTVQVFGVTGAKGGKLDMKANGSVNMKLAQTFDPALITSGHVDFTMAAGGFMKAPQLTGKVEFKGVNAALRDIPNGLSDLNGTLVFNEDRLEVEKLTAMTGGGQLKLGGFLTYNNGLYADLTGTGDVVRVRLYGLSSTANASLRLQGGPQSALLSGNVMITRFGLSETFDFAALAGAGAVSAPPDPDAESNKIRLDVHVQSAPSLDFQNSYAKLAGTVDLNIRGTLAAPTVLGRIQITDGSAKFAGTQYQLQRGDIYFTNPVRIDPTIDLDATAHVENYDITIGLHGTTTNLKPTYRSEPPLSEADIFALLSLGRTQEESQINSEQQISQGTDPTTSALLGGALNATVGSRISKLFGGGNVKIDPAFVGTLGGSSARITVEEQLSRQVTLTFATNVNQSAQQLVQVAYQLNPNMSIVATRDENGIFSIVYKIRKRYR